ncbi:hypothetical protein H8D57_01910 [bacterium]|nr:hypothetical protein [bacterium]
MNDWIDNFLGNTRTCQMYYNLLKTSYYRLVDDPHRFSISFMGVLANHPVFSISNVLSVLQLKYGKGLLYFERMIILM